MSKPNHSPLPWFFKDQYIGIVDANGKSVADISCKETNLDFLLRCVNSHYQLLSSLKSIMDNNDITSIQDEGPEREGWQSSKLVGLFENAKKAILLAEEGSEV